MSPESHSFRTDVRNEFRAYLNAESLRFPDQDSLRIDLHCHDFNSDVPDELWGRILRLPETWVSSEDLLARLAMAKTDAVTITNHNNARSCWTLLDQGKDILPGAEFTCHFEDLAFSAHVLAYGFSPQQETKLNALRGNAYKFLDYTMEHDIPTVLPHPLYLYHEKPFLDFANYEKLALMFERFEVMNGQRDVLQNLLVSEWLGSLNPEKLEELGKKHGIPPGRYCRDPYRKRSTGGSDDHFALFAGGAGTRIRIPDLKRKLITHKASELALEGLRHGDMAPYGTVAEDEKLSIAFLDYFCQVAMNMKDPGLLRMFLHRGDLKDKLICLGVSNAMQEMRRHKYTMKFLTVFHESLRGKKPGLLTSLSVNKHYRPLLKDLAGIAEASQQGPEAHHAFMEHIENMFLKINRLISSRISSRVGSHFESPQFQGLSVDEMIRRFELPSHFRMLSDPSQVGDRKADNMTTVSVSDLLDQLSFPALFYGIMGGARFMSSRVLYHDRATVQAFAKAIGGHEPPKRVLWLTDTLYDKNGVASVLQATLREVERRDLPIDFLICSDTIKPQKHLRVVPSMGGFSLKSLSEQRIQFPNLMDVHKVFLEGGYDRVMCSTEALMGVVALYLKQAFHVPAYFFMHTDWLDYVTRMTDLDTHSLDRIRRMLRALYRAFDGIFVLNSEHREWLSSRAIGMSPRRIFQTAHWTEGHFVPPELARAHPGDSPVLLFAGRLSQEKGVLELPAILAEVQKTIPGARLRIAGSGVAEAQLRELCPHAEFLGWVPSEQLAEVYGDADFLMLPSRFDTFGCVVTEAMACGLPVAAFNTKGPRDIIENGVSGVLGETAEEIGRVIASILLDPEGLSRMRERAIRRAARYSKDPIMDQLLVDMGVLPE
jgi:glycosyltransferase involved in cell wall biosynthesis